jgi:glyoxylase-like metal-dependent hydrolase (beta-lactamase superfamily II)
MKILIVLLLVLVWRVDMLTAQPAQSKVYVLRVARAGERMPAFLWADKAPVKDSVDIDFMFWLIKQPNGKNILFDAGFLNDLENTKEFGLIRYQRPDSALLKLGINAADISDIIISHPHWDHIDGLSLFPNAKVWMQKQDYNYFVGAAWQKGGMAGGFNKRDVQLLVDLNLAGRLTLLDRDNQEILPGIRVFTGSRHTYNSQYVLVNTGARKIVLASDNIWVYYSLVHNSPPSKGGTLDEAGYVKAIRRMKTLASAERYILPGHDGEVFALFPEIAEGIVEVK